MVKKVAGKDDISNIAHDRKHLITNSPFDRRVSRQVNIKDFTAKMWHPQAFLLAWVRWFWKSLLPNSVLVLRWSLGIFTNDVIVQMRGFLSFNNYKFKKEKGENLKKRISFEALFVFWKLYPKNFWLFLRCLY